MSTRPSTGPAAAWDAPALRRALRAWYDAHHRRLPWRETSDPYAVWVSEIMLQQTRVETVLGYYARFLETFPDIAALASASEPRVLAAWSGLGYYGRARNLRRAAGIVVREHAGRFPREFEAALALPGIGRSTAGAIVSIAYDEPRAVLDGNVARVLQRLHATETGRDLGAAELWKKAEELLPARSGARHTQAMMELGATVCQVRRPRCQACPVARWCRARALGLAASVPAPRERGLTRAEEEHAALAWRGPQLVLEHRRAKGPLHGMVGLPAAGTPQALQGKLGPGAKLGEEQPAIPHTILNRRIRTRIWEARLPARAKLGADLFTVPARSALDQPLDGTSRKALRRLLTNVAGAESSE